MSVPIECDVAKNKVDIGSRDSSQHDGKANPDGNHVH